MGAPGADPELQYGLDELEAKAKELETKRVPTVGGSPEKMPDNLATTFALWSQLTTSGAKMENTFHAGDVEAERLADAHRGAASAYKSIQQQATDALGQQMNGSATPPASMEAATPNIGNRQSYEITSPTYPSFGSARALDEKDWDEAAKIIHSGADPQALSLKYFRDQWQLYPGTLTDYRKIFAKPAEGWTGGASETCKSAMASLDSWWDNMGAECGRLAQEATTFADAHDKLLADHPTMKDVEDFEKADWEALGSQNGMSADEAKQMLWEDYQRKSEDALDTYAATRLSEVRPGKPPAISGLQAVHKGELPKKPEQVGAPGTQSGPGGPGTNGAGDAGSPKMPEVPSVSPASLDPSGGEQPAGSPSSGGGSPSGGGQGGGTPSGGGAPGGGMPSGLPKGAEGMPEMPGVGELSLKPASAGGGGGGMGGGGVPSMPLGPAVGAETVAASPTGARGVGGGAPGAPGGAGMGGMGGGMGGMGGGHGQGQGKEKRRNPNLSEDEDLYKEDRAYTEAVIGRRARPDAKDTKK